MQPNAYSTGVDAQGPKSAPVNHESDSPKSTLPYQVARINAQGFIENGNERKQFIVPTGTEIRFQLDYGTKISRGARLLVNKPKKFTDGRIEYTMTQPLTNYEAGQEDSTDFAGSVLDTEYLEMIDPHPASSQYMMEFRLVFQESGSFFIQISYEDELNEDKELFTPPQYINVEPTLYLHGKPIRAKELSLITVMSRQLGKMSRWKDILRNQRDLGYNAVHFTPFQVYGESYSHYSLADQLNIDDYFFDSPAITPEQRLDQLEEVTDTMRKEGMLSVVDIVLNHTAHDSKWIMEHPEACYNTDDCPHLYSAWLFDKALRDFSNNYSAKKVDLPCAPYIASEADLGKVMHHIRYKLWDPLKLHEFFLCDVNKVIAAELSPALGNLDIAENNVWRQRFEKREWFKKDHFELLRDELTDGVGGPSRMGVHLKMPEAAHYFMIVNNKNKQAAIDEVKKLLCALNDDWMKRVEGFKNDAMGAIEGTIRYFKLELGRTKITYEGGNMIVDPYFSQLKNAKQTPVAHNGWIGGWNCMEDFGVKGWAYHRRQINIWGDCVKLRYGSCPADSPYLWQHMTKYVQDMASVADGFRLDNTHSTPLHVCQYLLQAARSVNSNLFVMAELFTDSSRLDALFCQKLNLNGLVRELQNRNDATSTGDYFHALSCQHNVLGQVDQEFTDLVGAKYKILQPSNPCDMIYDVTHDNPSVLEKYHTGRMALPHLGLSCMADISIATTWGVDQLLKSQVHCVTEKRIYPVADHGAFYCKDPTVYPSEDDAKRSKPKSQPNVPVVPIPAPVQTPAPTSFEFEFWIESPFASSVSVAGAFNGWNKDALHLEKQGKTWRKKTSLPIDSSKSSYQFKFVVNGSDWVVNDRLPIAYDEHNNKNNKVDIPRSSAGPSFSLGPPSIQPATTLTNMLKSSTIVPSQAGQERIFEDMSFARMQLNRVHEHCNRLNASSFLHQQAGDVLVVTRQLPLDIYSDFDTYVSITRFCFFEKGGDYNYAQSIELPGFMSEVVFAGYLEIPDSVYKDSRQDDPKFIYGPRGCKLITSTQIEERLNFFFMPPSFTCVIKVKSRSYIKEAVQRINNIGDDERLQSMFMNVPTAGINHILFRCDPEEKDISHGSRGPYGLQNYGQFPYSGIASIMHMLKKTKLFNDMGAEIFENIRAGDWLLDYCVNRILEYAAQEPTIGLQMFGQLMQEYVALVKQCPPYMKPQLTCRVIETFFNATVAEVMNRRILDDFMEGSLDPFVQKMALACYQMYGRIPSVYFKDQKDSMCAGLTHFSTGYMRCWGRDTFIALRGLLIVTGLEEDARNTILFFAKVYRHGLLPNLHDGGGNTRFNSRDAPWFFLQAIKDYCLISEEGNKFLDQRFDLHFRDDDQAKHERNTRGRNLSILELILEICQRHAQGIEFREWNAGTKIDAHMKDNGFNIKITCDIDKTGFCFGGNKDNCGTWMDKMGSSDYAKNRGVPATPRDGAPIELVAMQFSILSWLHQLNVKGIIQQSGVQINQNGRSREIKFKDWAQQMLDNFERCFWVPTDSSQDKQYDVDTRTVNRRGIYKDVYGSADRYTDYQLRPNICIAMSYAPELFEPEHARICLKNIADILMERNCMGIKTLDPKDRNYRGDYINSDDTHGWNYHQGPEWVWPVGFFLKAQILFKNYQNKEEALQDTMQWLLPHKEHILKHRWQGLPELTNSHGKECPDSCVTQAWSISTLVDAMRDLYYLNFKGAKK